MNDHGPIEIRSAVLEAVDYPERQITVIAVPYDEVTVVEYNGRMVEESIAPDAFAGVAGRARKIPALMEHDAARWVGQVRAIWSDDHGLRARIQVRRDSRGTQEFDQVLDDAADGMLGASVGMRVAPAHQLWNGRSRRRITKAWLDHLALTAQPAYVGAEIVDVRTAPQVTPASTSATPNLDRIREMRRTEAYGST